MFEVSFGEMLLVGVVALMVLGPERLPKAARTIGGLVGRLKRYVAEVQHQLVAEGELAELKALRAEAELAIADVKADLNQTLVATEDELAALNPTLPDLPETEYDNAEYWRTIHAEPTAEADTPVVDDAQLSLAFDAPPPPAHTAAAPPASPSVTPAQS